jgi:uncharacterized membrane protein YbhN (UPF0104 family)
MEKSRAWVKPVALLAFSLVCGWIIVQLIGSVDWAAVGDALARLAWWQFPVLFAALLVRQVLNALPLALFIRGLSVYRAVINDLAAHLLAVVAPPPSDLVMRVGMFRSWGIDPSRAIAGATMNAVTFYVNRFAAPVVGFVLFAVLEARWDHALLALGSGLIAVAIAVVVLLIVRAERFATALGLRAGRLARRVKSSVEPEDWASATSRFRTHLVDTFRRGFPRSLLGLIAMVLVDATILTMTIRFVGVEPSDVSALVIIATFLVAYPLTLFPVMGLGILDAVLLGAYVNVGGLALEPELVAGLVVWRVVTVIGPIALGAVALAVWRSSPYGQRGFAGLDDESASASEPGSGSRSK